MPSRPRPRRVPWATLGLAAAATALHFAAADRALLYDRGAIRGGEVWRLWTGHLVHFGGSHLFWNLCVFVPAGAWLESLRPRTTWFFYAAAPLFISAALWLLQPDLGRYGGLSGVATGQLVLLACLQLGRRSPEPRWFWIGVLALVAAKIGLELFTGKPLLVSGFADVRDVPLAHLAGAAGAVLVHFATRRAAARHRG